MNARVAQLKLESPLWLLSVVTMDQINKAFESDIFARMRRCVLETLAAL